jgi:hypothetical protein
LQHRQHKALGGKLAQRLETYVNPNLDLVALRNLDHEKLSVGGKRDGSDGGSGTGRRRPPESLLTMLGAVGEHFVFEQMRQLLADFDHPIKLHLDGVLSYSSRDLLVAVGKVRR